MRDGFSSKWSATALDAEILVPEFGEIVVGAEAVRHRLTTTADALRWLVTEVLARLDRGMTDVEIIHDLPDPGPAFDHPHLAANYGSPDYVVHDLVREQFGWWATRNAIDLHPAHPDDAATAILDAIDPDLVLEQAQAHVDAGRFQLALHVVDLVALAPGDADVVVAARELEATCCEELARTTDPFVSQSLYSSSATLLRSGRRRWSEVPHGTSSHQLSRPPPPTRLRADTRHCRSRPGRCGDSWTDEALAQIASARRGPRVRSCARGTRRDVPNHGQR